MKIKELSKDLACKLDSLEAEAGMELALCVGCGILHSLPKDDENFGKCWACGDNTAFSGQLALGWIKMILFSLRKGGTDG